MRTVKDTLSVMLFAVCVTGQSNMAPPPSPSFCWAEVILGLTSLSWVYQFLNLPKNEWEFVDQRLIKAFDFILIYPLPWEDGRAGGVLLPEGFGALLRNSACRGRRGQGRMGVLSTAGLPVRSRWGNFLDTGVEELSKKWRWLCCWKGRKDLHE